MIVERSDDASTPSRCQSGNLSFEPGQRPVVSRQKCVAGRGVCRCAGVGMRHGRRPVAPAAELLSDVRQQVVASCLPMAAENVTSLVVMSAWRSVAVARRWRCEHCAASDGPMLLLQSFASSDRSPTAQDAPLHQPRRARRPRHRTLKPGSESSKTSFVTVGTRSSIRHVSFAAPTSQPTAVNHGTRGFGQRQSHRPERLAAADASEKGRSPERPGHKV